MWKINWLTVVLTCGITAGILAIVYFTVPHSVVKMLILVLSIFTTILVLAILGGYSLYNYTQQKKHDYLSSVEGAFNQTLTGIRNLIANNYNIIVRFIINKYNYDEMPKFIEFMKNEGIKNLEFSYTLIYLNSYTKEHIHR